MTRIRLFFCFYLVSMFFSTLHAQSVTHKADTAVSHKEYFTAIELYQKALKKEVADADKNEVYYKLGSCYAAINSYKEARIWLEKSIENGYSNPPAFLLYGDILITSCEYEAAKSAYSTYIKKTGDKLVKRKIASCDFALSGKKSDISYDIKNELEINSDFSDFGLTMVKQKLIFSSSRVEEKGSNFDNFTGQGFSDVYETTLDTKKGKWTKPVKLKGGINTKYNEGAFVYDKKSNTGYYMKCNGEKSAKENCNIFCSVWNEKENVWAESKAFDFSDEIFSTGQPALSSDGNTLYFVSNMAGGLGGKDLWVIKRKAGVWGLPKNLGAPVNTPYNEMFPYVLNDTLYFSSDGNIGFGGLDIFSSQIKGSSYGKPQNLLAPINSCADDFGIIFTGNSIFEGYFCSNRPGGKGEDDIYSFKKAPLILSAKGSIVDSKTGKPVNKVTVYLKGSDGSVDSTTTGSDGEFSFQDLQPGLNYAVTAVKEGFFSDSKDLTTVGIKTSTEFSRTTGTDLDFKFQKITYAEITIPNIYYDSNKAELKAESKKELNKMTRILKETPAIKVQVNSHTDEIGSDDYNMKLSEKRAQNVVDYFIENGIDKNRLSVMGFGESSPIKKNAQTENEHQTNRRTTFKVIKK